MSRWQMLIVIALVAAVAPRLGGAETPRVFTFIGDSTSSALFKPPGIPTLVSKQMHVRIHNLVIKYPPSYTVLQALTEQLPNVPADTTDAVVWLGLDDVRAIGEGQESLIAVEGAYARIIASLRARKIRVHELTIHDYTHEAAFEPAPRDVPAALAKITDATSRLNQYFESTAGSALIDVRHWHDVYVGDWSLDGIHMNAQRQKLFARHLADALTSR
jgi:hypothetical protein